MGAILPNSGLSSPSMIIDTGTLITSPFIHVEGPCSMT